MFVIVVCSEISITVEEDLVQLHLCGVILKAELHLVCGHCAGEIDKYDMVELILEVKDVGAEADPTI